MVVELEGDPDHFGAGARRQRGDDRAVDSAGHGDDDAGLAGGPVELEIGDHDGRYIGRMAGKAQLDEGERGAGARLTQVKPRLTAL